MPSDLRFKGTPQAPTNIAGPTGRLADWLQHLTLDAGINWLHRVAHLNPATSVVIREWDKRGNQNFDLRVDLLEVFREEGRRRHEAARTSRPLVESGSKLASAKYEAAAALS